MGNFYTNIVIVEPRADPVIAALERAGRNAFVANDGKVTIVYDERCDDQDLHELERLAAALARELGLPTLAVCNHDDDVLWYALADQDGVDVYNSWPGYFDEGGDTPEGGDARRLCTAFGVRDRVADVAALLEEPHDRIGMEIDRHARLAELLGIPTDAALLGYRYVSRGELALDKESSLTLRSVGGAAPSSESGGAAARKAASGRDAQPPSLGVPLAEAQDAVMTMAALAFNSVDVPDRFAAVLGSGRQNGFVLVVRLQRYVLEKKLGKSMGTVKADAFLFELLGEREFPFTALTRLVARAFKVSPLGIQDIMEMARKGIDFQKHFTDAIKRARDEGLNGPG